MIGYDVIQKAYESQKAQLDAMTKRAEAAEEKWYQSNQDIHALWKERDAAQARITRLEAALWHIAHEDCDLSDQRLCPTASRALSTEAEE